MMAASENDHTPPRGKMPAAAKTDKKTENEPQWANGLRRLYDSVVEEPLPDTFKDLLSKLDSSDSK